MAIMNFAYRPKSVTVAAATAVTFANRDAANHTVTADRGTFDLGNLDRGQSRTFRFSKPGTFTYHCTYHPFMHGTVVVK